MAQKQKNSGFKQHLISHSDKLLDKLYMQWKNESFCDMVIIANNKRVAVHACILSAFSSKVASTLLSAKVSEDKTKFPFYIMEVNFSEEVINTIVTAMYTGIFYPPMDILSEIYAAVKWLDIPDLSRLLEKNFYNDAPLPPTRTENCINDGQTPTVNLSITTDITTSTSGLIASLSKDNIAPPSPELKCHPEQTTQKTGRKRKSTPCKYDQEKTKVVMKIQLSNDLDTFSNVLHIDPESNVMEVCKSVCDGVATPTDLAPPLKVELESLSDKVCLQTPREPTPKNASTGETYLEIPEIKSEIQTNPSNELVLKSDISISKNTVETKASETVPVTLKLKRCNKCHKRFSSIESYTEHVSNHPEFKCSYCDEILYSKNNYTRHQWSKHLGLKCPTCCQQFGKEDELKKHSEEAHGDPNPFICYYSDCSYTANSWRRLRDHLKVHNEVTFFSKTESDPEVGDIVIKKCEKCFKKFTSISLYSEHIKDHPIFKCEECGIVLYSKYNYTRHQRNMHLGRPFLKCQSCGHQAHKEVELRKHSLDVHGDPKPFCCSQEGCTFKTARYSEMSMHSEVHSEKKYSCEKCGQRFSMKNGLVSHRLACYGLGLFVCDLCGKSFNLQARMNVHKNAVHYHAKPYSCKVCGCSFSDHSNLKRHTRIHSDSFPYSCQLCKKQFRHSNSLKTHRCPKQIETQNSTKSDDRLGCNVSIEALENREGKETSTSETGSRKENSNKMKITNDDYLSEGEQFPLDETNFDGINRKDDVCGEVIKNSTSQDQSFISSEQLDKSGDNLGISLKVETDSS